MYKIAICDDNDADRMLLIEKIKRIGIIKEEIEIQEYDSGESLLTSMEYTVFGAIFLNVQMHKMNAEETARKIRRIDSNLVLVFYCEDAVPTPEIFEVQPYRYIKKDMPDCQMEEYIKAALSKMMENGALPLLSANIGKRRVMIKVRDIIYIEKCKRNTRVYITKESHQFYGLHLKEGKEYADIRLVDRLEDIYDNLKKYGFGWPHNSYIINFSYLCAYTSKSFWMEGISSEFQIARSKTKSFRELKNKFISLKYNKDSLTGKQ